MRERSKKLSRDEFLETGGKFTISELEEMATTPDRNKRLLLVGEKVLVRAKHSDEVMGIRQWLIPLILVDGAYEFPEQFEGKFKIDRLSGVRFINALSFQEWLAKEPVDVRRKLPVVRLAKKGEKTFPENTSAFNF